MKRKLLAVLLPIACAASSVQAADSLVFDGFGGLHDPVESGTEIMTTDGMFSGVFDFSLDMSSLVSFTGYSNLPVLTFGLFDSTDTLVSGTVFAPNTFENSVTSVTLAAGDYYYKAIAPMSAATGSMYSFESTVSAVPEPETYGMMLAGLGMLGFVARRRMGRM